MANRFHVRYITRHGNNGYRSAKTYARLMEKALNEIVEFKRRLIRIENMPDGHMVVSMDQDSVQDIIQGVLQGIMPPPPPQHGLGKEAEDFLDSFFDAVGGSQDKNRVLQKMPEVLPKVCSKYNNQVLRQIFKEIKEYAERHICNDHNGKNECDLTHIMEQIVEQGEQIVKQSVC